MDRFEEKLNNGELFHIHDRGENLIIWTNIKDIKKFNELFNNYKQEDTTGISNFINYAKNKGYGVIKLGFINTGFVASKYDE